MITGRELVSLAAIAAAAMAMAQPVSYAKATSEVKAGTLLIESQRVSGQMSDPAPHVWYNLDHDRSIKPAAWAFVNPLGQTMLTPDARARWVAIAGSAPAVGSRVNKQDAPYWEVPLATTDDKTLAKFDVLLLPLNGGLSLNSVEREKLRSFMDQGGVLWIDIVSTSASLDLANGAPLPFALGSNSGMLNHNYFHPLTRYPNSLSVGDLLAMQSPYTGSLVARHADLSSTGLESILAWVGPDSFRLEPVAGVGVNERTISSARVGDGFMVVTTRGISATLNRGVDRSGSLPVMSNNLGYRGLDPLMDGSFMSAAKFAVNVISLGAEYASVGGGSRKSGSTAVDIQAPLLRRYTYSAGGYTANKPPAVYKGYIISTTSAGHVIATYANPSQDPSAESYVAWDVTLGSALSSPTCVTVPDTTLSAVDQVWVTDAQGTVHVLDLLTGAQLTTIAPPDSSSADSDGPYAPTIHEGLAFVADTRATDGNGRVWAIDLVTAKKVNTASNWSIQGSSRLRQPSASPTVGYIPIRDNSGGLDRVVYVPYKNSTGTPSQPAGMASLWLGARGENPVRVTAESNTQVRLTTRASLNGLPINVTSGSSPLGIKITLLKPNGAPFSASEMQSVFTGEVSSVANGEIRVMLKASAGSWDWDGTKTSGDTTDDVGWRIDYTIDWGAVGSGLGGVSPDSFVRGVIGFPDFVDNQRRVIGNVALGTNGDLYVVTAPPSGPGGTFMNLREEGRGDFRMVCRWDLNEPLNYRLNSSTSGVNLSESLIDQDPLVTAFPFLDTRIVDQRFYSGPAVRGDSVIVLAGGTKSVFGFNAPTCMVLSFKAKMQPIAFEISGSTDNLTLVQPDVARSQVKNDPATFSTLNRNQFMVESTDTVGRSRIVINSLMAVRSGNIQDCLTTSMPVIIRRTGSTDVVVEPEAPTDNGSFVRGYANGRFNPLQWYTVVNGMGPTSNPLIVGGTLYVGGTSYLPSITAGGFGSAPQPMGYVTAMDAEISPNDEFLQANSVRPWQSQLYQVVISPTWKGAPAIQWPQYKGIQDFEDFRVRTLQAALKWDNAALNLAGGEDTVAATGGVNLYAFGKSDFMIADEGRVSRFDAAGNPLWTTDQTLSSGVEGYTGNVGSFKSLALPNRVYPSDTAGYWIVDSGNDRVVRIDAGGREVRSISKFKVHPSFVPQGFGESESLTLRQPKDVLAYTTRHTVADVRSQFPGETSPDGVGPEFWSHTVIADSGNNRIVELIDRYRVDPVTGDVLDPVRYVDPQSQNPGGVERAIGVLYWHTPPELTGKRYSYNSLGRVWVGSGASRHEAYVFGFGNVQPGRATLGLDSPNVSSDVNSGFGGVVILDGKNSTVITQFNVPAVPANAFLAQNASGDFVFASNATSGGAHRITGLTSVTGHMMDTAYGPRLALMVCDSTGVYEIVQPTVGSTESWTVQWMLPMEAFVGMRRPRGSGPFSLGQMGNNPQRFQPMYARRFESGDVLVVNGYFGAYFGGAPFSGEVLVVDGGFGGSGLMPGYDLSRPNLGFNMLSVQYELPPVQGIRGIFNPTFAERQ